jgi:hypothetical protein
MGLELVRSEDKFVLRDTTNHAVRLVYTWAEIDAFVHGTKGGEFDRLVYAGRRRPGTPYCVSPELGFRRLARLVSNVAWFTTTQRSQLRPFGRSRLGE